MKKIILFIVIAAIVLALAVGISYKVAYNKATKDKDSTSIVQNVDSENQTETYGTKPEDPTYYHIDGTYVSESSYETESLTYVFDGDTVYFGGLAEQEGNYEIQGDKILINYTKAYDPEGKELDTFPYGESEEVAIIDDNTLESTTEGVSTTYKRDMSSVADGIVLYYGYDITGKKPDKNYFLVDMDYTDKNKEKYEITYNSYEKGRYLGKSNGTLEETYEDVGVVNADGIINLSKDYNPTPRKISTRSLPSSLKDAYSDYTKVTVLSADIDNEGGEELLVIYEKNLKAEDTESGEPIAESGIDLYDSSYEKLATLVESKDSFWLDEKVEEQKFFFELDDVEIADIDADGNMEILIRTPFWEALGLSIYKLENGKVKGDIGYSPVLKP